MNSTEPPKTSTRSLYLSNWKDMVGIWEAGKLTQNDSSLLPRGRQDQADAKALIASARAATGDAWFNTTAQAYGT